MKELFSITLSVFLILVFLMILTFSDMTGYILFLVFLLFGILNIFFNVEMPDPIIRGYKFIGIKLKDHTKTKASPTKTKKDDSDNSDLVRDISDKLSQTLSIGNVILYAILLIVFYVISVSLFLVWVVVGILYVMNTFFNVYMPNALVEIYKQFGVKLNVFSEKEDTTSTTNNNNNNNNNKTKTKTKISLTSDNMMPPLSDAPQNANVPPTTGPVVPTPSAGPPSKKDQVFHIKGGFDYAKARDVCRSYGAVLATHEQIENAHKKGAEWCDYGWSEDAMVLYPTQKKSWSIYQESEFPQKCGIPGVNGGYNNDLLQKLGANCYGKKPDGKAPPFAYPPKKKVKNPDYEVSPFNYSKWKI